MARTVEKARSAETSATVPDGAKTVPRGQTVLRGVPRVPSATSATGTRARDSAKCHEKCHECHECHECHGDRSMASQFLYQSTSNTRQSFQLSV